MASTSVWNVGTTTATGQIQGLQSYFNTQYYVKAGIATTQCSFGQSSQPGGTLGSVSAQSPSYKQYYTPSFSLSGLYPGEQDTLYGWAQADDNLYYPAGSASVTTYPSQPYSLSTYSVTTNQMGVMWSNSGGRDTIYLDINGGSQVSKSSVATSHMFYGLNSDTSYTIRIWYVSNGLTGSKSSITDSTDPPSNPRPSNWSWSTTFTAGANIPYYSGSPAPCTASEWNSFTSRINSFRSYKGMSSYNFDTAVQGATFPYTQIVDAKTAIDQMNPPTAVPTTGWEVKASIFNGLRDSLNSIP